MAVTAASCGSEEMVLGHPQAEHRPQTAEQSSSRGRSRDWALNTPRGTRASLLREKASADVRLELERIESSVASPVAKELSWVYSTGTARATSTARGSNSGAMTDVGGCLRLGWVWVLHGCGGLGVGGILEGVVIR